MSHKERIHVLFDEMADEMADEIAAFIKEGVIKFATWDNADCT